MSQKTQGEPLGPTRAEGAHDCEEHLEPLAKAGGPAQPRRLPHRYAQRLVDRSVRIYEAQMEAMVEEILEELSR